MCSAIAHPTIIRENASWTAARYNHPSQVRRYVRSATHKTFGAGGREPPVDQIIGDTHSWDPDSRLATLDLDEPCNTGLAHRALHPLALDQDAISKAQLSLHSTRPINTTSLLMDLLDLLYQPGIFLQAEDGIRDRLVTGVQTCALPIWFLGWRVAFCEISSLAASRIVDVER